MNRLLTILVSLGAVWLLFSCADERHTMERVLEQADSLLTNYPDSALLLLDSELAKENSDSHYSNQLRLRRLNAINKLDTFFTSSHVRQAQSLADHFNQQGSPNECLLAYYLLGRTYTDTGEAPQAIDSYQKAIDAVDTTQADCDYHQLAIVYGQMANLLYHQNLYHDGLRCLDQAIRYSYLADDTLSALLGYSQKIDCFAMLQEPDSVLIISETVSALFQRLGYPQEAAAVLALPVKYLIEQGEYMKARRYMDIYEKESGFFDADHQIEQGREVYYYTKGRYFLALCQYDSAECYFRKELSLGHDFNNQNAGARGLALLFRQIHQPDSATKYALYSYAMNDSAYNHESTSEVARWEALYNYSRYEHQAQKEKQRADHNRLLLFATVGLLAAFLLIVLTLSHLYWQQRKKKKEEEQLCKTLKGKLKTQQIELERLQNERTRAEGQQPAPLDFLDDIIDKRRSELTELTAKITFLEKSGENANTETNQLLRDVAYQKLKQKADCGKHLTGNDWMEIETFLKERIPEFYVYLQSKHYMLNNTEYSICVLCRLHIRPRSISFAIKKDPSDITHYRQALLVKLFGINGSSKDFDKLIWSIGKLFS